jgi:phospholipid/cholesterol/gamma-HCH transport system ATP-binding protein
MKSIRRRYDVKEKPIEYSGEETIIEVDKLNKTFGKNHVLRGFTLSLKAGENLVVVGRSGSGKSVLIKCIVGLIKPDSGTIMLDGKDVGKMSRPELDTVRQEIGFVFQGGALYDSMTIGENLLFHLRNSKLYQDRKGREARIKEVLDSVGLGHTADMMPAELSGGMQKRASLARSLVLYPKIMLYDEPTTGLDSVTSREIAEVIVRVQKDFHISSLIITHDMHAARIFANRMVILLEGKVHAIGTYDELEKSEDPDVRQFFESTSTD